MAKDYEIERIVFFGSRATGDYGKHSDVDLILVSKKFRGKSFLKRPLGLHRYWKMKYPVDFICYTPEEFEKLSKGVTIVQQALKKGIEI
ncbi:hypothetical protein A3K63_05080 [Candidatus Micrarchaeota archaeon RBG_16_49_10]|nr:MAG: hypothetical protein A3K63_05080 [Candidatus Micrarchaeota archaeon RBG_16_49_10]